MRRHVVLTHLGWPAKRFVYATGQEALWLAGGAFLALLLWRHLLPLCVVPPPDASGPPPLVVWAQAHAPAVLAGLLTRYVAWVPLAAAGLVLGVVAVFTLWEPEEKKLHRWALVYVRTYLRCPRVATYQPGRTR